MIHPVLEGNKYRKLKYIISELLHPDIEEIVSFGGAFSNHLLAIAQLGALLKIPSLGLIPTTYADIYNPTLSLCRANGMTIKIGMKEIDFIPSLKQLVIPAGGMHPLGRKGLQEVVNEIHLQLPSFTHIALPCGTGTSLAGIIESIDHRKVIGINVMKMDLSKHIKLNFPDLNFENLIIIDQLVRLKFGAYRPDLVPLIKNWFDKFGIILDMVYNAKAIEALYHSIYQGKFDDGSKIVYIHTGGTQGNFGFNYLKGLQLPVKPIKEYIV